MSRLIKTVKQAHTEVRKRRKGHRRKGILWDYNGDGQYLNERMNAKEKRYWRKWRSRQIDPDQFTVM